jgi:hypothetical protein
MKDLMNAFIFKERERFPFSRTEREHERIHFFSERSEH